MNKAVIAIAAAGLMATACASDPNGSNETLRQGAIGAGIGAVAGAIIGNNVGDGNAGRGAAIGAVVVTTIATIIVRLNVTGKTVSAATRRG